MIIKRSESASLLVSERVQIAPRAFRQRRNIARSAAVLTVGEQRVCHTVVLRRILYSPAVRLHANPSDWIEKRPFENGLFSWLPLPGERGKTIDNRFDDAKSAEREWAEP